jgi:hypothetical protein
MLNYLQLIIFRISAVSPIFLVFAILWYYKFQKILIPILFTIFLIISIIALLISFRYALLNLPPIPIHVIGISPADKKIMQFVLSYIVPFLSIGFPDTNIFIFFALSLLIIIILPAFNSQTPNPVLFCFGYHFYLIDTSNGIKDYLLITKQSIRNPSQIHYVKRLFEYLLYY